MRLHFNPQPKRRLYRGKQKATPKEQEHMRRAVELGCVVKGCRMSAQYHHKRSGEGTSQRANHYQGFPACARHHRDGGYGVAFHAGPKIWQEKHGTEEYHIRRTLKALYGDNIPKEPCDI